MERITLLNADCMSVMKSYPANYFELAVVDPPYGINAGRDFAKEKHTKKDWDKSIPHRRYFSEVRRVSRRQIIWGGNYFPLPKTGGWIFWDKHRTGLSFGDGELAWTSFLSTVKKASVMFNGAHGADKVRIHPTQKPVRLYDWIFKTYAQPGMKILDTHLGSGSSAISAYFHDLEFVGCELDEEYFQLMLDRFHQETRQTQLF